MSIFKKVITPGLVLAIALAAFNRVANKNIPSDLRDAVAGRSGEFGTAIPDIKDSGIKVAMPETPEPPDHTAGTGKEVFSNAVDYSKRRALSETNYLLKRIKSNYADESGMGREHVDQSTYNSVLDGIENIIRLVNLNTPPILRPKELWLESTDGTPIREEITLVVHAYGNYDYYWSSAQEMDRVIDNSLKNSANKIIYLLVDPERPDPAMIGKNPTKKTGHVTWMPKYKTPDIAYIAPIGAHSIYMQSQVANIVGGYWNGCFTRAVHSLIWNRELLFKKDPSIGRQFTINLYLKGIFLHYFNISKLLDENNPEKFINTIWHGPITSLTTMPYGIEKINYSVVLHGKTIWENSGNSLQEVTFNIIP